MGVTIILCTIFFIFAASAYICLKAPLRIESFRNWLLYSKNSTLALFGSASIILLYKTSRLNTADFGEYRNLLFVLFATICVLSFFKVRELLSVRGLAILGLFFFDIALDVLQFKQSIPNFILTFIIYIAVICAIVIGAVPYLLRDYMDYLLEHKNMRNILGYLFCLNALISLAAIF